MMSPTRYRTSQRVRRRKSRNSVARQERDPRCTSDTHTVRRASACSKKLIGSESLGSCGREESTDLPAASADARPKSERGMVHVFAARGSPRSEEHTSELQSRENLVCRLLLEKK